VVPRGSGRRVALVVVVTGLLVVTATLLAYRRPAPAAGPANPATSTLTLALPGPFNGCDALSPRATATTTAVLDLIRPSAFVTGPTNVLSGEGGAIVSAELISLHPETVVYTVAPSMRWSNGRLFSVNDLVAWWKSARHLASVSGDGYRAIVSMVANRTRTAVTAVFATNFADWDLLFRDVEEAGTPRSCAVGQLLRQPSLGPYRVLSASPGQITLQSNPEWTINYNRFHEVVITASPELAPAGPAYYVAYHPVATKSLLVSLDARPNVVGQFGDSSDIEEITFSPVSAWTSQRVVRVALSWMINRRTVLDRIFGSFTFTPSVPTSALFSQGQLFYPPPSTGPLPTQSNSALVSPQVDCRACAINLLRRSGFVRDAHSWIAPTGERLRIRVAVGPTDLDRRTARELARQWTSAGVLVSVTYAPSDSGAAIMGATGGSDLAVFDRPTSTTPWASARSWDQNAFRDAYPSGVASPGIHALFSLAQDTFNPATAAVIWLRLDHLILSNFWVRPLYTVPSLTEWSQRVANVVPSLSLSGLVDQVTNWGIVLPNVAATTSSSQSVG